MSEALTARNRLGGVIRLSPNDDDKIADARRALAAAKIADYIARTIACAPPLTAEQRDRLALLLRGDAA
jgi:hypothetical protein